MVGKGESKQQQTGNRANRQGANNTSSHPYPSPNSRPCPSLNSHPCSSLNSHPRPPKSEQEWARQKRVEGADNDAMDELMAMTGLEDVKEQFLTIKARVDTCLRQETDLKKERFGMTFCGNPGTGMVPRRPQELHANIL